VNRRASKSSATPGISQSIFSSMNPSQNIGAAASTAMAKTVIERRVTPLMHIQR
jgi:hypothetical protein